MNPSDKEIIDVLLNACEMLYLQTVLLRGLLRREGVADWRGKLDTLTNSEAATLVRGEFRRIYAQAVRNRQALNSFVENLPTSGSVQ